MAGGLFTAGGGDRRIPESIAIRIAVPGAADSLVDSPITVVVVVIADLGSARVGVAREVVAVRRVRDVVARLCARRRGEGAASIAIAVRVAVPGRRIGSVGLIDRPIAVIVEFVADLGAARIGCRHEVIAIGGIRYVATGLFCEKVVPP